ncbi:ead/Ea22-like family protein [Klebsiella variicola]
MSDITELAQRMKAAAEKASNGDWIKESGDGWEACCSANDQANGGFIIAHFEGPDAAENREFVQAANPANIRALVEALEKAQGMEAYWKTQCRGITDHCEELQARIAELESRTVTVRLPRPGFVTISGERTAVYLKADVDTVLAAAGIGEAE